jgi:hypothetical protein
LTTALQPAKSATDAAGDLFLSGAYFEIGISSYGNFGTTQGQTPAGFAQAGTKGVGLTYNQAGFGVDTTIPTIDFFTPGTPYESFAAGYSSGGTQQFGSNYQDGAVNGITATSLTNTSSGSALSAEWAGVLHGNLQVKLDYSFNATGLYFKTKVTLTNTSLAAMDDVRYDREVDPDNTQFAGGSYATTNTIVAQQPGSGASEVTAVSAIGDAYFEATGSTATLFYYSTDTKSRVSDGLSFGGTLNPFNPLFTTGAGAAGSTTGVSDSAVNINYDGGALAAGASTSFTYYTGLTKDVATTLSAISASSVPSLSLAPTHLILAAASDSGTRGDDITNVTNPVISGTADPGTIVTITDGATGLGHATADSVTGAWSVSATSPLHEGPNSLTATATDAAGNHASSHLTVTLDTTPPVVSESLGTGGLAVTGGGDQNTLVTLTRDGIVAGTARSDTTGGWSFDASVLGAGSHSLVATETDAAGNAGSSSPVSVTVPDSRFDLTSGSDAASFSGSNYAGPVSYLQAEYDYAGTGNVVIGARVANVFIYSGPGDDALAAIAGSNVLDGGTGSNWLVGASGADGGTDTFFVQSGAGQNTWDTLLNFHAGDTLTLWGFNAASGTANWSDGSGAAGYQGATITAAFGDGSSTSATATFAGLSLSNAQFSTTTGSSGGLDYLAVTRTG